MKVFEVTTEYCPGDSNEVVTERLYVTAGDNDLANVARHYKVECYQFEKELIGVRYVLDIVNHIEAD